VSSRIFRRRLGYAKVSIILSTETGSSASVQCSGSFACSGVWLALFPVSSGRRFLKHEKTELPSATVQLRHTGVTMEGVDFLVIKNKNLWQPDL